MKAFKFKLHAILALKTLAKNEALQVYNLAYHKRQTLEAQADSYKDKIYALEKNIDRERQSLSVAHKNAYYMEVLEHEHLKLKYVNEKIQLVKKEEKEALQDYLRAKQEEEMIKKMKFKLKAKYTSEVNLAEAKELEEMMNQRFNAF
jgi:hypothetical protein